MRRSLFVLLAVLAPVLSADVRVVFKVESSAMKSRYAADLQALEREVASGVAGALKEILPHWMYVTAEPSAGRIELQVDSNKATKEHTFRVAIMEGGTTHLSREVVWLKPGDFDKQIRRYPPRKDAPAMLVSAIRKHLLTAEREALWQAMHNVPIAVRSEWVPVRGRQEEPRIVAAVPWDGGKLGASMFAVMCRFRGNRNVPAPPADGVNRMLESQGLLTPHKFKDSRSEYDALMLRPIRRVVGTKREEVAKLNRGEVEMLQPLAVYLLLFDPRGLRVAESD